MKMEPDVGHGATEISREFKLEAVKLIGVAYAPAVRDLGVHQTMLRSRVKGFEADPQHSFPGPRQMNPEQLEIARLKRVTRLKAERHRLTSRRNRREVRFHREPPGGIWPAGGGCAGPSVSHGVGFYAWLMRPPSRQSRSTAAGACGTICRWKEDRADCIGSSGSCANGLCEHGHDRVACRPIW